MFSKDAFICLLAILFLAGFSYYSYTGYQNARELSPYAMTKGSDVSAQESVLLDLGKIEALADTAGMDRFAPAAARNPFIRYRKVIKRPKKRPAKITLPKPKITPVPVEPEPEPEPEPKEVYQFRGKVILGDSASYAIERESDKKTFFVNEGDKTRDFIVLETSERQVVITDYEENITILKKES